VGGGEGKGVFCEKKFSHPTCFKNHPKISFKISIRPSSPKAESVNSRDANAPE